MTIEEAIKRAEETAIGEDELCKRYDRASGYSRSHDETIRTTDAKECEKCAQEHRQLAEWLKDYKRLLESSSGNPTSSDDCISREQALDLLCKKCPVYNCIQKCLSYKAIEKMSSVTPQEPTDRNDNQMLEDIKDEILEQYWGDSRKEYFDDNDSNEYKDGALEAADSIIKIIDKYKRK